MKKAVILSSMLLLLIGNIIKGQHYTDWTGFEYTKIDGGYELQKDYTISLPEFFLNNDMPSKVTIVFPWTYNYKGGNMDYYVKAILLPPLEWDFIMIEPNGILTIKKGYRWDGASNPIEDMKHWNYRSSLVHDAFYDLMRMEYLDDDENYFACIDHHTHWDTGDWNRAMADILHYMIARQDGDSGSGALFDFRTLREFGACRTSNTDFLNSMKYHVSELTAYASEGKVELNWKSANEAGKNPKDPKDREIFGYEISRNEKIIATVNNEDNSYTDITVSNDGNILYKYQLKPLSENDNQKDWSNIECVAPSKGAGNAYQLDGMDDYFGSITVCNDLCNKPARDTFKLSFSVEAWVYPEEKADINSIVAFNTINGGNYNILMYDGDNQKFCYYDQDNEYLLSNDIFPENEWYHVAYTIDNLNQGILYVNGIEQITFDTESRPSYGGRFSIGQEWDNWGSPVNSQFFKGAVDEIRIWNKALSKEDILDNMYTPLYGNEAHLVSLWHFDEPNEQFGSDDWTYDATVNGNDGKLEGYEYSDTPFILSGAMQWATSTENQTIANLPDKQLIQNYPNPFVSSTSIKYKLQQAGNVSLVVYGNDGRVIEILENEFQSAGEYQINWEPNELQGGVYYCTLQCQDSYSAIKMVLIR